MDNYRVPLAILSKEHLIYNCPHCNSLGTYVCTNIYYRNKSGPHTYTLLAQCLKCPQTSTIEFEINATCDRYHIYEHNYDPKIDFNNKGHVKEQVLDFDNKTQMEKILMNNIRLSKIMCNTYLNGFKINNVTCPSISTKIPINDFIKDEMTKLIRNVIPQSIFALIFYFTEEFQIPNEIIAIILKMIPSKDLMEIITI